MDNLVEKYLTEYKPTAIFNGKKKTRIEVFFDHEVAIHRIPEWMRKWGLNPELGGNKWGRIQGNFKGFWFDVIRSSDRPKTITRIARAEDIKGIR